MRVLLVGGMGYIGSSVAAELFARGHDLVLAGRHLPNKKSPWGQSFVWNAVREWEGPIPKVDTVIHLASANGDQTLDTLETYSNNLAVTRNVIDLCRRSAGAAVLYVSTLQVYGRWTGGISTHSAVQPLSEYGFSHWVAEEHVRLLARTCNRKSQILRLSNVVGVGADPDTVRWGTVPAEFCLQAVQKRTITVKSSSRAQRDFITVGTTAKRICDFVEGMDFWDGQVKLVASGRSLTIGVVAKIVAELAEGVIGAPIQIESKLEYEPDFQEPELQVILDYHHPVESAASIEMEFRNAILDLLHLANKKVA